MEMSVVHGSVVVGVDGSEGGNHAMMWAVVLGVVRELRRRLR